MEMQIGICGIGGRMGEEVIKVAREKNIKVVLGIEDKKFRGKEGKDLYPFLGYNFPIINSPDELENKTRPDIIIDFSHRGAIIPFIKKITQDIKEGGTEKKTGFVIGTTGFSEDEINEIKSMAKYIPIFMSYNMSRGINLLMKILPQIKETLEDFDIEIVELHHRKKKDAPSGTALRLAEILRGEKKLVYGREGMIGPRKEDELAIFAVRGGDVVGEHIIMFLGDGERIEIIHRANSRRVFALGAIHASIKIFEMLKRNETGFITSF